MLALGAGAGGDRVALWNEIVGDRYLVPEREWLLRQSREDLRRWALELDVGVSGSKGEISSRLAGARAPWLLDA